ncbi:MAG: tape measure protein [Methylomarinum sp.]|nr:tape measure protein [Methylomarinum sp.]
MNSSELALKIKVTTDLANSVESFVALKKNVASTKDEFDQAQKKAKKLADELKSGDGNTKKLTAEFDKAKASAGRLKKELQGQRLAVQNSRKSLADAGVNTRKLSSEWTRLKKSLATARVDLEKNNKALDELAKKNTSGSFKDVFSSAKASAKNVEQNNARIISSNKKVGGSFAGIVGQAKAAKIAVFAIYSALIVTLTTFISKVVNASDSYSEITARIRLATKSQEQYNAANAALFTIAQKTRSQLSDIGNLFSRINGSVLELGRTQKDTLSLVNLVGKSTKISGASVSESSAAIRQFTQAVASGVLRGDEFNSIMENSPRLAQALADGLGVARGELRAMAEQGELTSDKVINALLSQTDAINAEFEKIPATVRGALTLVGNAFTAYFGQLSEATNAGKSLAELITFAASNFNILANAAVSAMTIVATVYLGKGIKSALAYIAVQVKQIQSARALRVATLAAAEAEVKDIQARIANTKTLISQITNTQALVKLRFQLLSQTQALAAAELELTAAQSTSAISTGKQVTSLKELATVSNLVNVAMTAMIGWEIGTWARENIPGVKQLGANLASMFVRMGVTAKTLFTGDLAAFFNGELSDKLQQIEDDFNDLYKEAENGSTANAEALSEIKQAQDQISALIKQRGSLEKKLAVETKTLAASTATEQIKQGKRVVSALEKDIQKSIDLQQKLADEIEGRQTNIARIQESTADKIRRIERESMSERSREYDIQKQITEELARAQTAAADDPQEAARLAKKAEQLAEETGNRRLLLDVLKKSSTIQIEAENNAIAVAEKARAAEATRAAELKAQLQDQKNNIDELIAKKIELEKPTALTITDNIDAVNKKIDALKEKLAGLGGTISINASSSVNDSVAGAAHGGLGYVPKESTYLLDKGERVLSPNQNKDLVSFLNSQSNDRVARFASLSPSAQQSSGASGNTVNITLPDGQKFGPFVDQDNNSAALESALKREVFKRGRLR